MTATDRGSGRSHGGDRRRRSRSSKRSSASGVSEVGSSISIASGVERTSTGNPLSGTLDHPVVGPIAGPPAMSGMRLRR